MTCENLMPSAIKILGGWKQSPDYEAEKVKVNKGGDPKDPVVTIEYCEKNELCTCFMNSSWDYFYHEKDCAGIKGQARQMDELR